MESTEVKNRSNKSANEVTAKLLADKKAKLLADKKAKAENIEVADFKNKVYEYGYSEGDFTYSVKATNTEIEIVDSEFGDEKKQLMLRTTISTSWKVDGASSVSDIFNGTSQGSFEEKDYVAFRTIKAGVTIEEVKAVVTDLNLVAIKITSEFPILTASAKRGIAKYDRTLEEIASSQAIPGTNLYSIGLVSPFESASGAIKDAFKIGDAELDELIADEKVIKISPLKIQLNECSLVATEFELEAEIGIKPIKVSTVF